MNLVTIKSYPSGIALHLDPDAPFEDILEDVAVKFEDARKFLKNAKVALSIEKRKVSDDEERQIAAVINEHSDVDLLCIVGKNEETNRKYVKALKRVEMQRDENNTRLYKGDISDGDIVESEGSLVVFGNVELGGAVVATKDIIVFGTINGQAYAGMSGDKNSVIICFGQAPRIASIANIKYASKSRIGFSKKVKFVPQILKLVNDKVVAEAIDEDAIREMIK